MIKLMGKKIFTFLRSKILFILTFDTVGLLCLLYRQAFLMKYAQLSAEGR